MAPKHLARWHALLVVLLWLAQAAFTSAAWHHVNYEDLAESVRNPFWFSQHHIYDGGSPNIGWYGALNVFYAAAGFSLHGAKLFRLLLSALTLLATSSLVRRSVPGPNGLLVMAIVGLSPTLQYFSSVQTSNGVDLQVMPLVLWCLCVWLDFSQRSTTFFPSLVMGALLTWAALSYPTILFYGPGLLLVFLWRLHQTHSGKVREGGLPALPAAVSTARPKYPTAALLVAVLAGLLGALLITLPLFASLESPQDLLQDPKTGARGLFKGGAGALEWNLPVIRAAWDRSFGDLVGFRHSYIFDVPHGDFASPVAWVGLAILVVAAAQVARDALRLRNALTVHLAAAALTFLLVLVFAHLSSNQPGIRRATPMLLTAWIGLGSVLQRPAHDPLALWGRRGAALILAHLVVVFPLNLMGMPVVQNTSDPFLGAGETPTASLQTVLQRVDQGLPLTCPALDGCRFPETYAAVASHQQWNTHATKPVLAKDPITGEVLTLTIHTWLSYRLAH